MHNKNYSELYKKINYEFKQESLVIRALTHRSYLNESQNEYIKNNERLEFLGDAVLELIVTQHLFEEYPKRPEGELTSFRAAVVRTESLAETTEALGIGEFILMSKGEEATGGRTRPYILANTFEAMLGAIYLDSSFIEAQKFVKEFLLPKLTEIVEKRLDIDPKSKLQELAQEKYKFTPIYELVGATGPDHDRTFEIQVIIADEIFGTGTGKSKQEAEQSAAAEGLNKFNI